MRFCEIQAKQSNGDFIPDKGSFELITETSRYWLARYDEGQAEFINLIYKKKDQEMQTIEA